MRVHLAEADATPAADSPAYRSHAAARPASSGACAPGRRGHGRDDFFDLGLAAAQSLIANLEAAIKRGAIRSDLPAREIIRQNFRNMGRSLAELVKVYYGLGDRIIESVKVEGLEHYQAALQRGGA